MYLEKRIKLQNNTYFVRVNLTYKTNNQGITELKLMNYSDDYYDGGDFSNLLQEITQNYTKKLSESYAKNISYMGDILYIYDRAPFLSGITDAYYDKNNTLQSTGYISREDIDNYIIENNIKMHNIRVGDR